MKAPAQASNPLAPVRGRDAPPCGCGKRQYATKVEAKAAAKALQTQGGGVVTVYRCQRWDRGPWHIGHSSREGHRRAVTPERRRRR